MPVQGDSAALFLLFQRENLQNQRALTAFITNPWSRRKNLSESLMNSKALGSVKTANLSDISALYFLEMCKQDKAFVLYLCAFSFVP